MDWDLANSTITSKPILSDTVQIWIEDKNNATLTEWLKKYKFEIHLMYLVVFMYKKISY